MAASDLSLSWFTELTGLSSDAPEIVRAAFYVDGQDLVSRHDGRRLRFGTLTTPSLGELAQSNGDDVFTSNKSRFCQVVGDVGAMHRDPDNAGAVFQVASQFNLLEMISPDVTPDDGIARYVHDRTQGPVCAVACGAGTLYRSYFVDLGRQVGQSAGRQLDMAADIAARIGPDLWDMRNGYLLAGEAQLGEINARLSPDLMDTLRIGVQSGTQVTGTDHSVTQAYCSAVPVAYSGVSPQVWGAFGRMILRGSYEACLHAAVQNKARTGCGTVFLTLLGGGAFGNPKAWIMDALGGVLTQFLTADLDVRIVSYGQRDPDIDAMLTRI